MLKMSIFGLIFGIFIFLFFLYSNDHFTNWGIASLPSFQFIALTFKKSIFYQ